MSYTPTNWQTGDTITAEKLNKIESGIEDAVMVVNVTQQSGVGYVADKTTAEIAEAFNDSRAVFAKTGTVLFTLRDANENIAVFSSSLMPNRTFNAYQNMIIYAGGRVTIAFGTSYVKPDTGIPETDLALAVQDKLNEQDGKSFVVTLTPTAQDYSGTMDTDPATIWGAYRAGKRILFDIPALGAMVEATMFIEHDTDEDGIPDSVQCSAFVAYNAGAGWMNILVSTSDVSFDYITDIFQLTPLT